MEKEGLSFSITDLALEVDGSYSYRERYWPHLPNGEGSISLVIQSSSASGVLQLTSSSTFHPQVSLASNECHSDVHITSINLKGGLFTKILDKIVFTSMVNDYISKIVNNHICTTLQMAVSSKVNPVLATYSLTKDLPLKHPLDKAVVDFSLTGVVEYSQMVEIAILGQGR